MALGAFDASMGAEKGKGGRIMIEICGKLVLSEVLWRTVVRLGRDGYMSPKEHDTNHGAYDRDQNS